MADEDDLDAFFDEVSEVEAKVTQEDDGKETKGEGRTDSEAKQPATEANGGQTEKPDEATEPPTKKLKTSAPFRPRGVVVASSTSVVMPTKQREELAAAELESAQQQQQQQTGAGPHFHHPSRLPVAAGPSMRGPPQVGPSIGPTFPGSSAPANNNAPIAADGNVKKGPKASVRVAAGQTWVDPSLDEWPENDYRIFVGNLSNESTDQALFQHFAKYPSVAKAKIVRHNNNPEKSKGYGFVSFLDPLECAKAIREMDQTWLCSRPIRVKRSDWKDRDFKVVKKKEKKEKKKQKRMGGFHI